ncbi:MAG: type II secretion system protein [Candidatus Dependentiae bacterium]
MEHFKKKGFTLIECLLVISLLSFLSFCAFFSTSFFKQTLEKTEIEKLYLWALHLQQIAQTSGTIQELVIDVDNNSYYVLDTKIKVANGLQFGKPFTPLPNTHHSKASSFKHNKIIFYPSGIISAGTVYLIHSQANRTYALSNAVSSVSFLRKYQYAGSWKSYS